MYYSYLHFNLERANWRIARAGRDEVLYYKTYKKGIARFSLENFRQQLKDMDEIVINTENKDRVEVALNRPAKYENFTTFSRKANERRSRLILIENLYQQLKANYEDKHNYGEAGDFHIGEMEMRRQRLHKCLFWV